MQGLMVWFRSSLRVWCIKFGVSEPSIFLESKAI